MKLSFWLLLLGALGLALYLARRRLRLALLVGGGLYVAITLARFLTAASDPERFDELALAFGGFAAVWLVLWGVTRLQARRRARGPAPGRTPGARAR